MMRILPYWKQLLSVLFLSLSFQFAWSQEAPKITLESPHNTLHVHLYYLQSDNYEPQKAARTIYGIQDTGKAITRAVQIKQILDGNGFYVRLNAIPRDPDYQDTLTGNFHYTPFPEEMPEIYLERIDGKWYYSQETLEAVPALHKKLYPFGADLLMRVLPHGGHREFLGLEIWQYVGILILVAFMFLFQFFLSRALNPLVRRLSRSKIYPSLIPPDLTRRIARLASMLILFQILRLSLPMLQLPIELASFLIISIRIVTTILIVLFLLSVIRVAILYFSRVTERTDSRLDEQLMPIVSKIIQVIVVIGGLIHILHLLEVNVTALIAGVSIGGLALALAAQDTVKHLIGSAMIFVDRPFQIGDWISGSGFEGEVDEVGFRTTRIKQLDTSIITVPNGSIVNMAVTNYGVRVYRLMNTTLGVTYDTPADKIELFLEGLKDLILAHPMTKKDAMLVNFVEMAGSSLNILFRVPLMVNTYADEQRLKQEIYLGIIRLAEAIGVSFAFPSTSVYVEAFPGQAPEVEGTPKDPQSDMQTFLASYKSWAEEQNKDALGADSV
jgi:MscS family membrane protein